MRKYLLITTLNLILVLVQGSFIWEFFGSLLNPNLIIALCFAFLLIDDHQAAMFSAFIGGLWLDLAGTGVIGLSSVVLLVLVSSAMWIRRTLFKGAWVQGALIIGSTIMFKLILNYPDLFYSWMLLIAGGLTCLFSFIFYLVLGRTKQRYLSFEFRIRA